MLHLGEFDEPAGPQLKIMDCEQNTPEWDEARRGIPTASCLHLILPSGRADKPRVARRKYMLRLLGERLTGELAPKANSKVLDRGHAMEGDAADEYEFAKQRRVETVGFMRRGRVGYSPDRVIAGENALLEIKSKQPDLQLGVIFDDVLPAEHKPQCQGGLMVSGYDWLDFVSYWPGLPLFVKRVYRDEPYIAWLREQVDKFNDELDALERQMRERYYTPAAA